MKKLLVMMILFPAFNGFSQAKWENNYDFADNCICGLSRVKKDGKIGYVTKEGVVLIPLQYEEGLTFKEGYTAVRKGPKWMYLDSTGKRITGSFHLCADRERLCWGATCQVPKS